MRVQRLVEPPISMEEEEEAMLAEAVEAAEALGAEPVASSTVDFPGEATSSEPTLSAPDNEA